MNKSSVNIFPWQQAQWQQLQDAHAQNRLPHALLLTGTEGIGLFEFAYTFATSLLCGAPLPSGLACGECTSCHLVRAQTHPDFFIIEKQEEGAATIKVSQIRELCDKLAQTSHRGGRQIVIINDADLMNTAASNALLKSLEEPSGEVLFLLLTYKTSQLLPTIRSRCQRLPFSPASTEQSQAYFLSMGLSVENAALLYQLSAGGPLLMHDFLEKEVLAQRAMFMNHLAILAQGTCSPTQLSSQYKSANVFWLMTWFESYLNDIVRLHQGLAEQHIENRDQVSILTSYRGNCPTQYVFILIDKVQEARNLLQQHSSLNVAMQLDNLFCLWSRLGKRLLAKAS